MRTIFDQSKLIKQPFKWNEINIRFILLTATALPYINNCTIFELLLHFFSLVKKFTLHFLSLSFFMIIGPIRLFQEVTYVYRPYTFIIPLQVSWDYRGIPNSKPLELVVWYSNEEKDCWPNCGKKMHIRPLFKLYMQTREHCFWSNWLACLLRSYLFRNRGWTLALCDLHSGANLAHYFSNAPGCTLHLWGTSPSHWYNLDNRDGQPSN